MPPKRGHLSSRPRDARGRLLKVPKPDQYQGAPGTAIRPPPAGGAPGIAPGGQIAGPPPPPPTVAARPTAFEPQRFPRPAPPNLGRAVVPHKFTFQGFFQTAARTYLEHDEALKHSRPNALIMWRDPFVRECIEARQRAVALLDWHLEPEDEQDEDQKELVTKLTRIIEEIDDFTKYRDVLMKAIWFGKYGIQNLYRNEKVSGRFRTVVKRWVPIHGDKIIYRYDDGSSDFSPNQFGIKTGAGWRPDKKVFGRLRFNPQGIKGAVTDNQGFWRIEEISRVRATQQGLAYFLDDLEMETITIHKHMIEDGAWESPIDAGSIHGVGIRSFIYWTWFQRQELQGILLDFLERSSTGVEIWTYPAGNDTALAELEKAALERSADARNVIFFPKHPGDEADHYRFDVIFPNMAGAAAIKEIVEMYFGRIIKRYILGQVLTTEVEATGIGSGMGSIHLNSFLQIVRFDARGLEETLTRNLVTPLKEFNFPKAKDIKIKFRIETEVQDVDERLQALNLAWQMGTRIPENEVFKTLGIGQPDDDDVVLENPATQAPPELGGLGGGNGGMNGGGGLPFNRSGASIRFARKRPAYARDDFVPGELRQVAPMKFLYTHPNGLPYEILDQDGRWLVRDVESGERFGMFDDVGEAVLALDEFMNEEEPGEEQKGNVANIDKTQRNGDNNGDEEGAEIPARGGVVRRVKSGLWRYTSPDGQDILIVGTGKRPNQFWTAVIEKSGERLFSRRTTQLVVDELNRLLVGTQAQKNQKGVEVTPAVGPLLKIGEDSFELSTGGSKLMFIEKQGDKWVVLQFDKDDEKREEGVVVARAPSLDEAVKLAQRQKMQAAGEQTRAPEGGLNILGDFFEGGEFIPADVEEEAAPEVLAKLDELGISKDDVLSALTPEAQKDPDRVFKAANIFMLNEAQKQGFQPGSTDDFINAMQAIEFLETPPLARDGLPSGAFEIPPEELAEADAAVVQPESVAEMDAFLESAQQHPYVREAERRLKEFTVESMFHKDEDTGDPKTGATFWSEERFRRDDGSWDPNRAQLHDRIVDELLNENAKAKPGVRPQAFILMGAPASGKTSVGSRAKNRLGVEFTTINPDDVKERMPEYEGWNAGILHEESSHVSENLLQDRAMEEGHNLEFDITGKNSDKVDGIVAAMKAAGYDIHVAHTKIDDAKTSFRAFDRFRQNAFGNHPETGREIGRYVPPSYAGVSVDGKPEETFNRVKASGDIASGVQMDTDVPFGEEPSVLDKWGFE